LRKASGAIQSMMAKEMTTSSAVLYRLAREEYNLIWTLARALEQLL
jgi:DNA-binding XRE family transcriptional regulator